MKYRNFELPTCGQARRCYAIQFSTRRPGTRLCACDNFDLLAVRF